MRARADDAGIEVRARLAPAWTRGNPALLERMIANLIDNGVRHNEHGGQLEVATGAGDGSVQVLVTNGGPVIDVAEAATLSEPFRRLGRSLDGFGLGLSIVSSVVSAHHGSTEIVAPRSGGLEVRVTLPALPGQPNVVVSRTAGALTES
jgi:signal transduction histidine kinase